jgi:two-component system, OmpR family, phosphate regulon sensor histidine kinase PhoR
MSTSGRAGFAGAAVCNDRSKRRPSEGWPVSDPRILIVDDDPALLEALPQALSLRMEGLQVDTCDSAPPALLKIQETDYDAIVTDVKMPGMDGLALLREIRKIRPSTPTLLITGHGERELTVEALRGGAYDFIQKPIERDILVAALNRAFDKRRLDREVEEQNLALVRHARVLENVGDGVFLVDRHGVVRLWNAAAEAITGLPADSVLGRPAGEALPGWDEVAPVIPVSTFAGASDEPAKTIPFDLHGNELWLSISGVEFADGTVYDFRDLTTQRVIEELKDEFVATVSHELRTPLAAIYGASETLRQRDGLDPDDRQQLLTVISQESERLARVVEELLLAGQIDSQQLRLVEARVDAAELTQDVVARMEQHARNGVTFSLVAPPSLPALSTDPDKFCQVLINLIENAMKYSPEGGRVEVTIEPRNGHLSIAVRDEGLGIPASEQRLIFDKFYRVDPNLTRGVGGTGLGLYVCRELVHLMGGRIWVESAHGRGSTFFVDLPLAVKAPREREPDAQPAGELS